MNEDERGITPADSTAITIEPHDGEWLVTIEQGNGDVIKQVQLTNMERIQLAMMLDFDWLATACPLHHVSFLDPR